MLSLYAFAIENKQFDVPGQMFSSDAVGNHSVLLGVVSPLSNIK